MNFSAEISRLRVIDAHYPARTDFDTHMHEEGYLCLVVRGRYEEWRPERRCVGPGTDQVWRAGSRHAVRTGPEEVRILHIADPDDTDVASSHPLRVGILWQLAAALVDEETVPGGPAAPRGPATGPQRLHLESLVAELTGDASAGGPLGGSRSRAATETTAAPWLDTVRARLRDGISETVSVRELASLVGRHPSHLVRAFRQRWGMTPGAYQRRLRVAHAIRLLRESDLPLSLVALEAGFSDQSHMGRWLRRYARATPGAIRSVS